MPGGSIVDASLWAHVTSAIPSQACSMVAPTVWYPPSVFAPLAAHGWSDISVGAEEATLHLWLLSWQPVWLDMSGPMNRLTIKVPWPFSCMCSGVHSFSRE